MDNVCLWLSGNKCHVQILILCLTDQLGIDKNCLFHFDISVGSNPYITNFDLLRTWKVEHQTPSNPSYIHQNQTSNPSKNPKLQPCLTRKGSNPGQNLEKLNFEPFQTQVRRTKNPPEPSKKSLIQHYSILRIDIFFNFYKWLCS